MTTGNKDDPTNEGTPTKQPAQAGDGGPQDMSRRKLVYAAPMLVSASMLYQQTGCGKANPRTAACQRIRRNS
jgi:hypothetical protein